MTLTPRDVALEPGGERLAVTVRDGDGVQGILLVELVTGRVERLGDGESQATWGPGGRLVSTADSPDGGTRVLLREPGRPVRTVWVAPGTVVATAVLLGGTVVAVAARPSPLPRGSSAVAHATRRRVHKTDADGYVGDLRPVLHLVDAGSGAPHRVALQAHAAVEALVPSPDGTRLAARLRRDDFFEDVLLVDARSAEVRPLPIAACSLLGALSWVDDDTILGALDTEGSWHPSDLAVIDADGARVLVADAELEVHGADGHVVWGTRRGRHVVLALDVADATLTERATLPVQAHALTHDAPSGRTAAVAGPAAGPLRLLCAEAGAAFEQLVLAEPVARRARTLIASPELLQVGDVECFVARPPEAVERLVVDLHGGPFASWGGGYDPLHAGLLDAGFAVVTPNVTGSTSYGRAHAAAIIGAWGEADLAEVLAVADAAAGHLGCEPARAGVTGYSYGGYLAAMLVATTDRFAAAVCAAPVWDLRSAFGTGDEAEAAIAINSLGLSGHDLLERADRHSPARTIGQPTTPTLLLAGEADLSCALSQSEQAFFDLSWLGCEVELVRYPGQNHASLWGGDAAVVDDRVARTVAWLAARV